MALKTHGSAPFDTGVAHPSPPQEVSKGSARRPRGASPTTANLVDESELITRVAKNLWMARVAAGMTQDGLADRSGVSRATIAQIECGATDCRVSTLAQIARALGISPVLLLLNENDVAVVGSSLSPAIIDRVRSYLSPRDVEQLIALRGSGMQKNLMRVAQSGVEVARRMGLESSGAAVGATIGAGLAPGLGAAVGALLGTALEGPSQADPSTVTDGGGI